MSLRVLGVGSPLGADRLGWRLIELLAEQQLPAGVSLKACDRPGPGLVSEMAGADGVIVIDALCGGCEPGAVLRLEADAIRGDAAATSSHAFGVAEAIELARVLDSLPPRLCLLGLCVAEDGAEPAAAELAGLLAEVMGQIRAWSGGAAAPMEGPNKSIQDFSDHGNQKR